MRFRENNRHMIDILFVLSLFLLFSVSSVILILFGVNIYNSTISSMTSNYSSRTSAAYITEKIRQSDICDAVSIDNEKGYEQLILTRSIDGQTYATFLYEYNGYLYELFARTDIELSPDAGHQVIALTGLDFEFASPSLLRVSFIDEAGKDSTVYVSLHCDNTNAVNDTSVIWSAVTEP